MFENFQKYTKWAGAATLAGALCFGAGYYLHKPSETSSEKTVEKTDEKTTDTKKTTQTVTKPDGTKVVTTTEENTQSNKTTDSTDKKQDSKTTAADAYRPTYSAGAEAATDFKSLNPSYRITAGYRVLGNMWIVGGYNLQKTEASAGLRVDF